jgi:hypothetical protein
MARTYQQLAGLALVLVVAFALCEDVWASDRGKAEAVVIHVERGGFQWSDAAIGMVAGLGVSLAVCGCLALVRLRGAETVSPTGGERP